MNRLSAVIVVLWCAISVSAAADTPPSPNVASKKTDAAAAFEKAAALGPQHRLLAQIAGNWAVTQSIWTGTNSAPKIDRGNATFAMVIGGRHLRQELRITSSAKPFEGLGYIGYDNLSGDYYSSWMDVNFTGVILVRGTYDADSKTYTFVGDMADPANDGSTTRLREVLHVVDADHFTYEYYETRGSEEALAVRLEYTRS